MRDITELGLKWSGPPLLPVDVQEFAAHFSVSLPADYLRFLAAVNGGDPALECYNYIHEDGEPGQVVVGGLHYLTADHEDIGGVWKNTQELREYLAEFGRGTNVVCMGRDGSIMPIFLNMSGDPPSVHILYVDEDNLDCKMANSFEEFIDGLSTFDA